jgi:putative transposase
MSHRSFKIELKLNATQRVLCAKGAGTSRYAYNWKLRQLSEAYEKAKLEANGAKPNCKFGNAISWHKEWNQFKNNSPWIREVSKCCGQEALRDLQVAFQRFFAKKNAYPNLKKKGSRDSFRLTGTVKVGPDWVQLPNMGKVKLKEQGYAISEGFMEVAQATVSRTADRWFVAFSIDDGVEDQPLADLSTVNLEDIVGLDLGTKELGITSDGEVFANPKAYKAHLMRLRRYQKTVSRKQKGSSNKKKAIVKLSRVHARIANIRSDATHKMTTSLAKTKPKILVIESLRPKNMCKNHNLAGSILDAAFGRIKVMLAYKCKRSGVRLISAPVFYASSKFCSHCGWKYKDLQLSEREWTCEGCGTHHDRDVNAAKNLQFLGAWLLDLVGSAPTKTTTESLGFAEPIQSLGFAEPTGSSPGSHACGDERLQFLTEQCSSMKQEFKLQNHALHSFT